MIALRTCRPFTALALAVALLAVHGSLSVAEPTPAAAPSPASARIQSLAGTLLDMQGKPLAAGSELKAGTTVRTAPGQLARLVLVRNGLSSGLICIEPDSEVSFLNFTASTDDDYPLLDAELALRNARVRAEVKRIF